MASPLINLVPLPLKLGSYSSDKVAAELQTNEHEFYAACALSVFPAAAQLDHLVASFKHDEYQAVRGNPVQLGAIAFSNRRVGSTSRQSSRQGFAPWPGELNDIENILAQLAMAGKNPELTARLRLAQYLPRGCCAPMTLWPIHGGRTFEFEATRVSGGSSISELVLWCVRLPKAAFGDACNLTGLPHWIGLKTELAEAAGSTTEHDVHVSPGDAWGLRLRQMFATCFNAADASHSETHLNALKGRLRLEDREIYPAAGQKQLLLSSLYAECVQDFDPARDPGLVIPPKRHLRHEFTTLTTTGAKDLRLAHYGTLVPVAAIEGVRSA